MKEDDNSDAWFTTMVDFYRLPRDFPGYQKCFERPTARERIECLEWRLALDVSEQFDHGAAALRFVPYIQLHEFEALLFSNPLAFLHAFPDRASEVEQLNQIKIDC